MSKDKQPGPSRDHSKHDHHDDHDHSDHDHSAHNHGHHHHLPSAGQLNRTFAFGIGLNLGFVLVEAFYGYVSHSLSLMADAGHNLSDVLGLGLAWGAIWLGQKKPSHRYTYGFRSSTIMAAVINSVVLIVTIGAIIWQAIFRLQWAFDLHALPTGAAPQTHIMMIVAGIGIFINTGTALLFLAGSKDDLNIRGAFLHMAGDALVSLGVVICGALMAVTGWFWLDPVVSLVISAIIFIGTWQLLRHSLDLALAAVPPSIDATVVKQHLLVYPGVEKVHDLHIWAISTTETALTAHLVMPKGHPGDAMLNQICQQLQQKFKIHHATLQIELGDSGDACAFESEEVV
jgi:cobalt-zinc-cadmium efflux system protein